MPSSHKSKPVPGQKPLAAKPAQVAPVKKPATQAKPGSPAKPDAAKPAPAKPAPAKPDQAKHHQPAKAQGLSNKPAAKPAPDKKSPVTKAPEPVKPAAKVPAKPTQVTKPEPTGKSAPFAKPATQAKPTPASQPSVQTKAVPFAKPASQTRPTPFAKPEPIGKSVPFAKPTAQAKQPPAAKPAPFAKSEPAAKAAPVTKTAPATKPSSQARPVPVAKSVPAAKPAAPAKPAQSPKPVHTAPPSPAAKPAPVAKASLVAAKPSPATPAAPAAKPASSPAAKAASAIGKAAAKADALRARILERRTAKPIAFTLDEVREIAKVNLPRADEKNGLAGNGAAGKARTQAEEIEAKLKKAAQPHFVKAASLADILGYNPAKQAAPTVLSDSEVDPKFQRYYKLLIDLREHVASGLDTHTEQTLKRSSKDDSGDLSGYGQHMADAGTDTFDRDFALSLVSNEQEALAEVEAAIQRIKLGTYGVCELTGKPINKDRLMAVPFARFSVESQTEVERTKRRTSSRAGLFGESEDGAKMDDDGGGGGDD